MTLLFELIGVAILILLNAFFVAAEYGLVTARRTRIIELQHQGDRRARDVLRITGDPGRFIAAMQLGVTLTSLGIGALGEATLSREFDKWMSTVLAIVIAYAILSFFHVVFGELVPKGAALGHAEGTALWVSAPVRAFFAVFRPVIWFLQVDDRLDPAARSASSRRAPSARCTPRPSCGCSSPARRSRGRSRRASGR